METLIIEKTNSSPYIELNEQKSKLIFRGKSFPENSSVFYEPVIEWLKTYLKEPKELEVEIELTYMNSSSLKVYFDILDILENSILENDSKIIVKWFYDPENDVALETGEDLQEDFDALTIELIEID